MKKIGMILITLCALLAIYATGCIAKDPKHDTIIQEIKDGLQAEYSEDVAQIERATIFENTLKVYMLDDYPPERLEAFAKETSRLFGIRMRAHKKLESTYHINFYQNKMIDDKMVMKQTAECLFENSTDRTRVKVLGLGEGKYDVK